MTLSDKLTRDQVRDAITANLTYSQIQPNDIRALEGFLCIECARGVPRSAIADPAAYAAALAC